ncbi:MAG: hypothetical protein ACUVUP_00940 [Thermaceae bacterium]
MKRAWVLILLLLSPVLAQRAVSFRFSLSDSPGMGLGLETSLERDLALRVYGDLSPAGPTGYLGGEVLFKPGLGRALRGIRPYLGGGLGTALSSTPLTGLGLTLGVEVLLDAWTGVFLDGEYFYGFGGGRMSRLVLGVNLR